MQRYRPFREIAHLADSPNHYERAEVAEHPTAPRAVLGELARDPSPVVRAGVACLFSAYGTRLSFMSDLIRDPNALVRDAARSYLWSAQHCGTPLQAKRAAEIAAKGKAEYDNLLAGIALPVAQIGPNGWGQSFPMHVHTALAADQRDVLYWAIPHLSNPDDLDVLARHENRSVRREVACHASLGNETRVHLLLDPAAEVAAAAQRRSSEQEVEAAFLLGHSYQFMEYIEQDVRKRKSESIWVKYADNLVNAYSPTVRALFAPFVTSDSQIDSCVSDLSPQVRLAICRNDRLSEHQLHRLIGDAKPDIRTAALRHANTSDTDLAAVFRDFDIHDRALACAYVTCERFAVSDRLDVAVQTRSRLAKTMFLESLSIPEKAELAAHEDIKVRLMVSKYMTKAALAF